MRIVFRVKITIKCDFYAHLAKVVGAVDCGLAFISETSDGAGKDA